MSTNMVDDEGVDLVFHRRDQVETLSVQVKARATTTSVAGQGKFVANVGASTLRPRLDLYLLFVLVDTSEALIDPAWLVPSTHFAAMTKPNGQNRHRFHASTKATSNDRWTPYRFERSNLAARLLNALDVLRIET